MMKFLKTLLLALLAHSLFGQNNCLNFDGTSDFVLSTVSPLSGNANCSMEAWVTCNSSTTGAFRPIVSLDGTATRVSIGEINGIPAYSWRTSTGTNTPTAIPGAPSIRNNGWHHLAVTRNGSEWKVYLNCVEILSMTRTGNLAINSFRAGSYTSPSAQNYWQGNMDEVRVWDHVRTPAQLCEFKDCRLLGNESGLKINYSLNQGTAGGTNTGLTTATDNSPNANTGNLNTFALTGATSNWVAGNPNFSNQPCCPVDFTFVYDSCGNVDFTAVGTVPNGYTLGWDFDNDGNSNAGGTTASYNFSISGSSTVCLMLISPNFVVVCTTCKSVLHPNFSGPPTVTCPPDVTVNANVNCVGIYDAPFPMVTDDECSDQYSVFDSRSDMQDLSDPFPVGVTTITWAAINDFGTSTCTQTVTVVDNTPPIAICNADISLSLSPSGMASLPISAVDAGSFDNCGPVTLSLSQSNFACANVGVNTVVLTVADDFGNINSCFSTVTVVDNIPPVAVCQSQIQIQLNANCDPVAIDPAWVDAGSSDNCPGLDLILSPGVLNYMGCNAPQAVTLTVEDASGNTSECNSLVFLEDNTPPTIVCPANVTIQGTTTPNGCFATIENACPAATDNCSDTTNLNYIISGPNGYSNNGGGCVNGITLSGAGVYLVTYSATDLCGNTATCTFTVTVECQPPTCTCGSWGNIAFSTPNGDYTVYQDTTFDIECPPADSEFSLSGSFSCNGNCDATGMNWSLTQNGSVLASGPMGSSFAFSFSSNLLQANGTYLLTLQGHCGNSVCDIQVWIVVDGCEPPGTLLECGDAVVTCYSGLPGASGVTAALKKLQAVYVQPVATNLTDPPTPPVPTTMMWTKTQIGEVFGLAIDNNIGDIYFTSSVIYGPTTAGPDGYGGVYKIDGSTLTPDPIFNISLPNSVGNANIGPGQTIQHAPGLGNVCFDGWNNQLFVTNFEDGKIYRIGNLGTGLPGTVLSSFDPLGTDDGLAGFAPLGERLWGIGITENSSGTVELYYSVWAMDKTRVGPQNSIRKVNLLPSGDFDTGSDVLVFQVPLLPGFNYSNPVSDIAFSQDKQTMLLAERSMGGDMKPTTAPTYASVWAHHSRLMRYEKSGSTWNYDETTNIGQLVVGNYYNSAGGTDFGHYLRSDGASMVCDTSIWCTADAIVYNNTTPYYNYGMQGFYDDINPVFPSNSWWVDFDGLTNVAGSKSLLGDVEIYKCNTCPTTTPCDGITALVSQDTSEEGCCYDLTIGNLTPDFFTYVSIEVSGANFQTPPPPAAASGWSLQAFNGTDFALFAPAGGGTIPTGTSDVASFCYENVVSDVQTVVVSYYDEAFQLLCSDTLQTECIACVEVVQDSVYCTGWNEYAYEFCINVGPTLPWDVDSVVISAPGIVFTPANFSAPSVLPGETYCSFTTGLGSSGASGLLPGDTVCFTITIHNSDGSCCSSEHCIIVPECNPCDFTEVDCAPAQSEGDTTETCCFDIFLSNPPNVFTNVTTNVLTPGVGIESWDFDPAWFVTTSGSYPYSSINWDATALQGNFVAPAAVLPTMCFGPAPVTSVALEIVWEAEDGTLCRDTCYLECDTEPISPCADVDSVSLICGEGDGSYTYVFDVTNTSTATTMGYISLDVSGAGTVLPNEFWGNFPPGSDTTLTVTLTGNPGDDFCFFVSFHELDDDSLHINCCVSADSFCVTLPECAPCPGNIILDGGFELGYTPGTDGFGNPALPWFEYEGSSPQISTNDSCTTPQSARMWGNQVVGEGVEQDVNLVAGNLYEFTVCGRFVPSPTADDSAQIRIMLDDGTGSYANCTLPNCRVVGITPILPTTWGTYTFTDSWPTGTYTRLIITPWNNMAIDDGAFVSWVGVDDVCVTDIGDVPTGGGNTPPHTPKINPNPIADQFTIAFQTPKEVTLKMRIFDALGQIIFTDNIPAKTVRHEVSTANFPAGVYFVEILENGRRSSVQRVVKQ